MGHAVELDCLEAALLRWGKNALERALEPAFDVINGVACFLLQTTKPLILLAFVVGQVVVGEVAPLLLGLAFNLVPVATSPVFGAGGRSRGVVGLFVEPVLDVVDGKKNCMSVRG